MEIWPLKVVDTVVSTGSVTTAAAILHRSQPQVSKIIRSLEADLGFRIFDRIGRRMVLTPRGIEFAAMARSMIEQMAMMESRSRALGREHARTLHIVAPPYASRGIIPMAIARLLQEDEDLSCKHTILRRTDQGQWVVPHDFDLCISILPFDLPRLVSEPMARLHRAVIAPRNHPILELAAPGPKDVAAYPLVVLNESAPLRRELDAVFTEFGVCPRIAVTAPDTVTACELVAQGVGITVGGAIAALSNQEQSLVLRPFWPDRPIDFGASFPIDRPRSELGLRFAQVVKNIMQELPTNLVSAK